MDQFLSNLTNVSSPAELEEVIVKFDAGAVFTESEKNSAREKLNEISENKLLANNAKIRRRIQRCIQSFDAPPVVEVAPVVVISKGKNNSGNSNNELLNQDLPTVIQALNKASTINNVQHALDAVIVPEKREDGEHSAEFLVHRIPLKSALERVAVNENITNKVLRKRIKRLIFVLSTKEEQAILTALQAEAAKNEAKNEKKPTVASTKSTKSDTKSSSTTSAAASKAPSAPVQEIIILKTFAQCLVELNTAKDSVEIENAISGVSVNSLSTSDAELSSGKEVKNKLDHIVNEQKELISNAKVRRMVNRLLESLSKSIETVELKAKNNKNSSKNNSTEQSEVTWKVDKTSNKVATPFTAKVVTPANKPLSIPSIGKPINSEAISIPTHNPTPAVESEPVQIVPGASLEGVIEKVRNTITTAEQLEDCLADVKPESGNCTSRRLLKRAIERVLTQENISSTINAKIRRRITRVIKILEPKTHAERNAENLANGIVPESKSNKKNKKDKENAPTAEPVVKIPYVVFIGQLSYDTTPDEIENHLRVNGVEGPISVRLLQNKDGQSTSNTNSAENSFKNNDNAHQLNNIAGGEGNNEMDVDGVDATTGAATTTNTSNRPQRSKGMAFVEVEGARELHKCIALHHSKLGGRVINIEKSCGGKNKDTRASKIEEKRREQMEKVRLSVEKVLMDYDEKGVISFETLGNEFKKKIYRYTPGFVQDGLKAYSLLPEENRTLAVLDKIFISRELRTKRESAGNFADTEYYENKKRQAAEAEDRGDRFAHGHSDANGEEQKESEDRPVAKKSRKERREEEFGNSNRQPVGFEDEYGNGGDGGNNNPVRNESRERRKAGQDAENMRLDEVFPSRRGRGGKVF